MEVDDRTVVVQIHLIVVLQVHIQPDAIVVPFNRIGVRLPIIAIQDLQ